MKIIALHYKFYALKYKIYDVYIIYFIFQPIIEVPIFGCETHRDVGRENDLNKKCFEL